jgi:hypothetical protein
MLDIAACAQVGDQRLPYLADLVRYDVADEAQPLTRV